MACPICGCKTTYQYDEEDAPDSEYERCAACGVIFSIEDHTDEEDEPLDYAENSTLKVTE